jgi:predicted dehydrogenase
LSEQDDVLRSHAIFITSPNDTHAQYLSILGDHYDGYIYCEKPPINQTEDIGIFDSIDSKRCFFGFNLRYSEIHEYLSVSKNKYKLGGLIYTHIHQSYPFAMKPEYQDSWKSKRTRSPYGVIENLGIHHIDMAISFSGEIVNIYKSKSNIAKKSETPDSAFIFCEHANSSVSNIFVSYATSFREEI